MNAAMSVDDMTSGYGSIHNYQPLLSNFKSTQMYNPNMGDTSDFETQNNKNNINTLTDR